MSDSAPNPLPDNNPSALRPPKFEGAPPVSKEKSRARSKKPYILLASGLLLFALGTGPLLLIMLFAELGWSSDPNPNPIGPGLLAMCTVWPSLGLMVAGGLSIWANRKG